MTDTIETLAEYIPEAQKSNQAISLWSVGMQIHHSLLATMRISQSLVESKPGERNQSLSILRSIILVTGKIPRGRGKAPEPSIPNKDISQQELGNLILHSKTLLKSALQTNPKSWWEHFAFGVMHRNTALKFIHVHNRHHISIISDILSS